MIDLQVRDESGRVLEHASGFAWTQELIDIDSSVFPMLAGLCAYLDTVFNQRQLPLVLDELDRLPYCVRHRVVDARRPPTGRFGTKRSAHGSTL
ncbi:hypothetical protein AB0J72_54940 [Dactylosporangium sp. NPDC049742]|uniref:hypothetical protein n=1 Tax=Dactylosporangium sp. NPDC049742 TaxID=3154737 RepID=UPI0034307802